MMKKIILALGFLVGSIASAAAACTSPAIMHDFAGTSFNMSLATNAGDGNCSSNMGIIGTLPGYASTPTFNLGTLNGAATAAKQPALGTAGSASADVLTVQGIASMTPLLATVTGTVAATQSGTWNVTNISGTVSLPTGAATAANQATLITNTTGLATSANQTTAQTSLSAMATSLSSIDTKASASIPVTVNGTATAQTGLTPGTAQTGTIVAANMDLTSMGGVAVVPDACAKVAHVYTRVDIASIASSVLVPGTASKKTYICSMMLFSAGTTNVGIVEGSGTTCGTSPLGLVGGNTAAKGPNLTAQAGFVAGNGLAAIAGTTVNANDICLINSAAVQVSGYIVTATP